MIAGNGYLVMRLSTNTPSANDTGFRLKGSPGDDIYFYSSQVDPFTFLPILLDSKVFGFQVEDHAIGAVPEGTDAWTLTVPTPGAPNVAASLGDVFALRINKWLADASNDPDEFEIYNGASCRCR